MIVRGNDGQKENFMKKLALASMLLALVAFGTGCVSVHSHSVVRAGSEDSSMVGVWRAKMQFKSGMYATIKDLELFSVYNLGGTMTESSKYDEAPPVPPAYGVWRKTAPRQFEAKYVFYLTKAPVNLEE